jgi:hypothetical protein
LTPGPALLVHARGSRFAARQPAMMVYVTIFTTMPVNAIANYTCTTGGWEANLDALPDPTVEDGLSADATGATLKACQQRVMEALRS